MTMLRPRLGFLLLSTALLLPAIASAHEGHDDHDEAAETAPHVAAEGPRFSFSSPHLEAVAMLGPQALLIYADDFQTNQPLAGLDVGVRSGGRLLKAQETEPGLYSVPRDLLAPDETLALEIGVHAASWDEHFSGTLPAMKMEAAAGASALMPGGQVAAAVFALLFAVVVLVAVLRKRRAAADA